jgi:hypothetical protein
MTAAALYVSIAILAALAIMQILLIFGVPIGKYAWGGKNRVLPPRQRIAAAIAIVLYAVFTVVLLGRVGVIWGTPSTAIVVGTWVLFGYTALSVLPNLASKSRQERAVQVPVSVALAIAVGFVASSGVA